METYPGARGLEGEASAPSTVLELEQNTLLEIPSDWYVPIQGGLFLFLRLGIEGEK